MQNKSLKLETITHKQIFIDDNKKICGYASVFYKKDHHGDIIVPGAFANVSADNIKFLWQHDANVPIGKITKIYEDHYGLYIEVEIITNVVAASEAYSLVRAGAISGLSIGFQPIKYHYDELQNRVIEEIDLWEISLVTFPANQSATITDVKNCENLIDLLNSNLDSAIRVLR